MPPDDNLDIAAIKDWMAKEPHLPNDLDDFVLKKFLHSCYYSLERTKECIERFCTTRCLMPEIYTRRDPRSDAVQAAFSITNMTSIDAGEFEVMFHQINDPGLEKFVYYDIVKVFGIISDYHIQNVDTFPDRHVIIIDMKDYTLKIIPKVNVISLRHFLMYLLETVPLRVKKVMVVNSPTYYETIYALVKPVLPNHLRELISFHLGSECLKELLSIDLLPQDYGGNGPSLYQKQRERHKDLEAVREWFLDDTLWKADLKKKPKTSTIKAMAGSFKTLSID